MSPYAPKWAIFKPFLKPFHCNEDHFSRSNSNAGDFVLENCKELALKSVSLNLSSRENSMCYGCCKWIGSFRNDLNLFRYLLTTDLTVSTLVLSKLPYILLKHKSNLHRVKKRKSERSARLLAANVSSKRVFQVTQIRETYENNSSHYCNSLFNEIRGSDCWSTISLHKRWSLYVDLYERVGNLYGLVIVRGWPVFLQPLNQIFHACGKKCTEQRSRAKHQKLV